ncbi:hypothetical protein BOTBODRAFT_401941 [Botryobasidium botryosum FD-172 SS1]|uniref:Uncharacterized protein n=1 Tax=Botryobasidium botryosum (strain FD-172 SS1) TaxID=930990 RepID=A0A067MNA3_BOTB1|nr:hypothetical protein BOTBODRAFT_401941 [Botryobasidium botryosum FD-172 SS1]
MTSPDRRSSHPLCLLSSAALRRVNELRVLATVSPAAPRRVQRGRFSGISEYGIREPATSFISSHARVNFRLLPCNLECPLSYGQVTDSAESAMLKN